jgi:hypothetical protein
MNVEIGTYAAKFPEKEYINGIFVAVCLNNYLPTSRCMEGDKEQGKDYRCPRKELLVYSFLYAQLMKARHQGMLGWECNRVYVRVELMSSVFITVLW